MSHFAHNKIPCLVFSAEDDPICLKEAILTDLFHLHSNYLLAKTKYGSHIAFREGVLGQRSWMMRVSVDFLDASYDEWMDKMLELGEFEN
jgi:predicted alpha/beta-fold hydrolase